MNDQEFYKLISRVMNGFLFHATEEIIRQQLETEGIPGTKIDAAIIRGKQALNARLSNKERCSGDCEPMCPECNRLADQAAQDRQSEWEGYEEMNRKERI